MVRKLRSMAKRLADYLPVSILPKSRAAQLARDAAFGQKAHMLGMIAPENTGQALRHLANSQSQINQDFFVLPAFRMLCG